MGATDNGDQILTFDYLQEGRSQGFNKLNHLLFDQGIFSGGTFNKVSDTEITIDPLIGVIRDDTNEVTIRLETTTTANVTVNNSLTYIIARLEWINTEDNYVDFLAVANGSITSSDIILGRLNFSGTTLSTTFDYTQKGWHPWKNIFDNKNSLKVIPSEPYAMTVDVEAGNVYINGEYVEYAGTTTGTITAPASDSRIDLISIDDTGSISVTTGTPGAIPVVPDFPGDELVLAYITIASTTTKITGDLITPISYEYYFTPYGGTSTEFENGLDGTDPTPSSELGKSGKAVSNYYGTSTDLESGLANGSGTSQLEISGKAILDILLPIGKKLKQLPFEDDPNTRYSGTTWVNISEKAWGYELSVSGWVARQDVHAWSATDYIAIDTVVGGTYAGETVDAVFNPEGKFERIEGTADTGMSAATFETGDQPDAGQRVTATFDLIRAEGANELIYNETGMVTSDDTGGASRPDVIDLNSGTNNCQKITIDTSNSVSPQVAKTDDYETRPINFTVRMWVRTI